MLISPHFFSVAQRKVSAGLMRFAVEPSASRPVAAAAVLADCERRNRLAAPLVRHMLARLAGFDYDGSEAARRRLASALPLVAFTREHSPGSARRA